MSGWTPPEVGASWQPPEAADVPGKKSGIIPGRNAGAEAILLPQDRLRMLTEGGEFGGGPTEILSTRMAPAESTRFRPFPQPASDEFPDSFSAKAGVRKRARPAPDATREVFGDFTFASEGDRFRERRSTYQAAGKLDRLAMGMDAYSQMRAEIPSALTRESAELIDLGIPGTVSGVGEFLLEGVSRLAAANAGADADGVREFGKYMAEEFKRTTDPLLHRPLSRIAEYIINDKRPTTVGQAMEALGGLLAEGAEGAERSSGGAVKADDINFLLKGVMNGLGAKGIQTTFGLDPRIDLARDFRSREMALKPEAPDVTPLPEQAVIEKWEARRAAAGGRELDALRNAEMEAYTLMQSGASAAAVERAIGRAAKRGTPLGDALEVLRARREGRSAFDEIPEIPIREDGTFAPRAKEALLRENPDMTPTELAARVKARGGRMDPALAVGEGGRSSRDPRRRAESFPVLPPEAAVKRGPLGEPIEPYQPYIDTKVAAGLGAAGAAALLYTGWEDLDVNEAAALLGVGALSRMPAKAPLGALKNAADGTLKTLERLPQNKFEFSLEEIRNQLKRADVTENERRAFAAVLDGREGDRITAMELLQGLSEKTEYARLTPLDVDDYADYGLDNIGRHGGVDMDAEFQTEAGAREAVAELEAEIPNLERRFREAERAPRADFPFTAQQARSALEGARRDLETAREALDFFSRLQAEMRTTLYTSPFALGEGNHFGHPNYFAHARSFTEGDVRHVVEIQSDVAQRAGKPLAEAERAELTRTVGMADSAARLWDSVSDAMRPGPRTSLFTGLEAAQRMRSRLTETIGHDDQFMMLEYKLLTNAMNAGVEWNRLADNFAAPQLAKMSAEQVAMYERGHVDISEGFVDWILKHRNELSPESQDVMRGVLQRFVDDKTYTWELRVDEARSKLAAGAVDAVRPMLKDWWRRVINEEIGQAGEARAKRMKLAESYRAQLDETRRESEAAMAADREASWMTEAQRAANAQNWAESISALEGRIRDLEASPNVIRFATADTVAKVERWAKRDPAEDSARAAGRLRRQLANVIESLNNYREAARRALEQTKPWQLDEMRKAQADEIARREENLARLQRDVDAANAEAVRLQDAEPAFSPEHQGIYDRYKSDIEKYLRTLGGKPFMDSQGVTWLEVPLPKPDDARVPLFGGRDPAPSGGGRGNSGAPLRGPSRGQADPQLVNALGVLGLGATAGYLLADEEDKPFATAAGAVLAGAARLVKSRSPELTRAAKSVGERVERIVGIWSTAVGELSQPVLRRARELERAGMKGTYESVDRISGFVNEFLRTPEAFQREAAVLLFNGNEAAVLARLPDALAPAYRVVRQELTRLGNELKKYGLIQDLIPNYFPRVVKDYEGLLNALELPLRDALDKKLTDANLKSIRQSGRELNEVERSILINRFLEQSRGGAGKPSFTKARRIDQVTEELLPFYDSPEVSLTKYVQNATWAIERAKFFGKELQRSPEGAVDIGNSIANYVEAERAAGRLKGDEVAKLTQLLNDRFVGGERSGMPELQTLRTGISVALIANTASAAVQIGDVFHSVFLNGLLPTVRAVGSVVGKGTDRVTARQFGMVNHLAEELVTAGKTAKLADFAFKYSGFRMVDLFAKDVFLTAAATKARQQARTRRGVEDLRRRYGDYFGERDFEQLIADLQNRNRSVFVDELLFAELTRVQPIARSEMPAAFLANPEARLMWTMKSWMLKQLDLVRREVWQEARKGNVGKATEMGLRIGAALYLSNVTGDAIRNWMLGRETPDQTAEEILADVPYNLLKTFGVNDYFFEKVQNGQGVQAALGLFSAPVTPVADAFNFIVDSDPRIIRNVPIIGRHLESYGTDELRTIPVIGDFLESTVITAVGPVPAGRERWAEAEEKRLRARERRNDPVEQERRKLRRQLKREGVQ